jgi:chaperone required for assembly of F1-ATPase
MKRFWTEASVGADRAIMLDGRPVRTPGRAALTLPTDALAEAVAAEWREVVGEVDPRAMPLTGLANAAIDIVTPDPAQFAAGLAAYGASDLLCYRADDPPELVERQRGRWDPVLDWVRARYDVHVETTAGIVHVAQPDATIERLSAAIAAHDAFTLAAASPVVTITGSLMLTLALIEGAIEPEAAWDAAHVDEDWQAEQWGSDDLAIAARTARRADYDAAVRFLSLL